ncbi:phospholipase-like protein [Tanacetum coccineum]
MNGFMTLMKSRMNKNWKHITCTWQEVLHATDDTLGPTYDAKPLEKETLIPLAQDIVSNASLFETYIKKEMFEYLKYVQSLEKEVDDLKMDNDDLKYQIENENMSSKFYDLLLQEYLGTVLFENDQFLAILGYEDLFQGNVTIERVYYVEGLNHNLFFVAQFYYLDLEIAFKKSTCFIRDLQENDLLTGTCGSDLYTIALQESSSPTPICFMANASPTQAWLWHLECGLKASMERNAFCTKLEIQDHINEPSNSKLVPNVVPIVDKTNASLKELELLFSPIRRVGNRRVVTVWWRGHGDAEWDATLESARLLVATPDALSGITYVKDPSTDTPFVLDIGQHTLEFGRREFCLVIGFRFGNFCLHDLSKGRSGFRNCEFPGVARVKGIKLNKLLHSQTDFNNLLDDDVVRVCLMLALDFVFMGFELRHVISKEVLKLVDDFSAWDNFPWGHYIWEEFHKKGFVFPLKIWLLETFPTSKTWWFKEQNVIPMSVAWSDGTPFLKCDYDRLFNVRTRLSTCRSSPR